MTALVGAFNKNGETGAAYIFTHAGGVESAGDPRRQRRDDDRRVRRWRGAHHGFDTPGAAYVFVRAGSTWTQQRKLTASDGAAGDFFGFVTISADGNTVVVGADARNGVVGAAYVFVRGGTVWTQQTILTASDGTPGLALGDSVALNADGTTAVIGGNGASYVFVRSGATWTQQQKLTASDGVSGDAFGYAVGVSAEGGVAIVGAIRRTNETGGAYVFVRGGGVWSQAQILATSDRAQGDQFGNAIALSADGGAAVIGAPGKGTLTGAVYRFSQAGSPLPPPKPIGPPTGNTSPAPRPPEQPLSSIDSFVPAPLPINRPYQQIP
ncbi:MAG: FG-GAP repeat protein [Thermomicrobiales bacterium]